MNLVIVKNSKGCETVSSLLLDCPYSTDNTILTPVSVQRLFNFSRHKCGAYLWAISYLNIVPDKFTFSVFLFNGTLSIC